MLAIQGQQKQRDVAIEKLVWHRSVYANHRLIKDQNFEEGSYNLGGFIKLHEFP